VARRWNRHGRDGRRRRLMTDAAPLPLVGSANPLAAGDRL